MNNISATSAKKPFDPANDVEKPGDAAAIFLLPLPPSRTPDETGQPAQNGSGEQILELPALVQTKAPETSPLAADHSAVQPSVGCDDAAAAEMFKPTAPMPKLDLVRADLKLTSAGERSGEMSIDAKTQNGDIRDISAQVAAVSADAPRPQVELKPVTSPFVENRTLPAESPVPASPTVEAGTSDTSSGTVMGNTIGVNYGEQTTEGSDQRGSDEEAYREAGVFKPAQRSEKPDAAESIANGFVEKVAAAAARKNVEESMPVNHPDTAAVVYEQVEARLIGLAGLTQKISEKRILKMRLHPAELGTVEITLEKNLSGTITARLRADSERTCQLLGETLGELRQSLENSGWNVADLNISYGSSSSHGTKSETPPPSAVESADAGVSKTTSDKGLTVDDGHDDRLVNLRA